MSLIKLNTISSYNGTLITINNSLKFLSVPSGTSVNYLGIDVSGNVIRVPNPLTTTEVFVTGGTYSNGTAEFTNITGGTFNVIGFYTGSTAAEVFVTGGTYNTGVTTFRNNTGGTFNVTGYYTGSTAAEVFVTGGTYTAGTATFANNTGGTFSVTGFYTGSTGGGETNISDALYTVNNNLKASGTTTATTSVCIYGVNVFTGVTSTNLATKLPQPITGKSVKIVNNGLTTLAVYPSNIGGRINNLPINTPAQIPADGKLYEFICIVNPLPGIWTFSAPATAQYDSGEMSISITAKTSNGFNPVISAYNSAYVGNTKNFNGSNYGYNGKNKPSIQQSIFNNIYYLTFRPDTPWLGIAKIKVYTNLINGDATEIRLGGSGEADYYSPFDGSLLDNGPSSSGNLLFRFYLNNKISGTAVTGSTVHTSANIGDNGTSWGEKVANTDSYSNVSFDSTYGTFVGNKTLGTVPFPYTNLSYWTDESGNEIVTGDNVELFYSSYLSFQIQPFNGVHDYGVIPDFKFRFVIEYYS